MSKKSDREMAVGVVVAAVFVLIGAALIAFGTSIHRQHSALKAHGRETAGVIIGFERIGQQGGPELRGTFLVPVVRFTASSGQEITFLGSTNTSPPWADYRAGGKVAVIYDPQQPENARIDTFAEIWFAPLLLWIVGGAAMLIPPWTIWRYVRSKSAPPGSKHH